MMMKRSQFLLLSWSLISLLCSCENEKSETTVVPEEETSLFTPTPTVAPVDPELTEASGIADSKTYPGYLWVHEDSGTPSELQLLSHSGSVLKSVVLEGIINRDWEDMTLAGNDLYIADIGDNNQVYPTYSIYKFTEPVPEADIVSDIETISFQYPDGSHDAEAILVDPQTKDIFIITKKDNPSRVYKVSFPFNNNELNTATLVGTIPFSGVVSTALSPDGKELIVKTYTSIRYYEREAGETIGEALQNTYTEIPYEIEPQGEAITFAKDNSGFFTLSEKGNGTSVSLYFYQRNK